MSQSMVPDGCLVGLHDSVKGPQLKRPLLQLSLISFQECTADPGWQSAGIGRGKAM